MMTSVLTLDYLLHDSLSVLLHNFRFTLCFCGKNILSKEAVLRQREPLEGRI
jgi:hypothetical protein